MISLIVCCSWDDAIKNMYDVDNVLLLIDISLEWIVFLVTFLKASISKRY